MEGNTRKYPRYLEIMQPILDHQAKLGFSACAPEVVYTAADQNGLVNLAKHSYNVFEKTGKAQVWLLNALSSMLPIMFIRSGKAPNEDVAQQMTIELLKEIEELYDLGLAPDGKIGIVVGQKARN